ncbi:hypothetical protein CU098_007551 [Rhizopus stolonifer]|uniref:Uncharacterized protein n=1 Tax=Rhizopus stolonifer TaxID=4846 RepID=A0A367KQ69_RHIST|nr:hypothetical protein CU098_007551 [Rhizopus stolonifer]
MFFSYDSAQSFAFTFRAMIGGEKLIDDLINVDEEPLFMDDSMNFGESMNIDDPTDIDPPEFDTYYLTGEGVSNYTEDGLVLENGLGWT